MPILCYSTETVRMMAKYDLKTLEGRNYCESCQNSKNPCLSGVAVNERSILDGDRNVMNYSRGDLVYREGTFPSGLFCLRNGKVMITKKDQYNNEVVINLHKEVSFLGISDLFANTPYSTDCYALTDCQICMIRKDHVNDLLDNNKAFARNVLKEIADHYHQSNKRMLNLTKKYMRARVADALFLLKEVFGLKDDGKTLDVYLKRKHFALLSNMNISNAIRNLSSLQKDGIIQIANKNISIEDMPKLIAIKDQE